jgi:hypothetical protein
MKIYFTGASSFKSEQKDKDKSLGGYMASTSPPNDVFSNIFGEISLYGLDEKLRETRALIIHNDTNSDLENLYLHFDKLEGSLGTFEVAAVSLTADVSNGEVYMEQIDNIRSTPYTGAFVEAEGFLNKKLLTTTMASKSYIGLWLRRTIKKSDKDQFKCSEMYSSYKENGEVDLVTEAGVGITLNWDD